MVGETSQMRAGYVDYRNFLQAFVIVRPASILRLPGLVRTVVEFKATPAEVESINVLWKTYLKAQHSQSQTARDDSGGASVICLAIKAQLRSLHQLVYKKSCRKQTERNPDDDRFYSLEKDWTTASAAYRHDSDGSESDRSDSDEIMDDGISDSSAADDPAAGLGPAEDTDPMSFVRQSRTQS